MGWWLILIKNEHGEDEQRRIYPDTEHLINDLIDFWIGGNLAYKVEEIDIDHTDNADEALNWIRWPQQERL